MEHPLQVVSVFETREAFALMLAKGALEEAGIEFMVSGENPRYIAGFPGAFGLGDTPVGANCDCQIMVHPEDADQAREILGPIQEQEEDPDAEDPAE